jgi:hypothetical protein
VYDLAVENVVSRLTRQCLFIAVLLVPCHNSHGISFGSYSQPRHNRFYSGVDKDFVGDGFDWSGVARAEYQTDLFNGWATMISDTYFVSATHFHPQAGHTTTFFQGDSLSSTQWTGTVASGSQLGDTDIWIGQLNQAPPNWVERYPLIKRQEEVNYLGVDGVVEDLYAVGKQPGSPVLNDQDIRVGRNTAEHFSGLVANLALGSTSVHLVHDYNAGAGQVSRVMRRSSAAAIRVHQALLPLLLG